MYSRVGIYHIICRKHIIIHCASLNISRLEIKSSTIYFSCVIYIFACLPMLPLTVVLFVVIVESKMKRNGDIKSFFQNYEAAKRRKVAAEE